MVASPFELTNAAGLRVGAAAQRQGRNQAAGAIQSGKLQEYKQHNAYNTSFRKFGAFEIDIPNAKAQN